MFLIMIKIKIIDRVFTKQHNLVFSYTIYGQNTSIRTYDGQNLGTKIDINATSLYVKMSYLISLYLTGILPPDSPKPASGQYLADDLSFLKPLYTPIKPKIRISPPPTQNLITKALTIPPVKKSPRFSLSALAVTSLIN